MSIVGSHPGDGDGRRRRERGERQGGGGHREGGEGAKAEEGACDARVETRQPPSSAFETCHQEFKKKSMNQVLQCYRHVIKEDEK